MNRYFVILILFFNYCVFAQESKTEPSFENFQKRIRYIKSPTYKGPQDSYASPSDISKENEIPPSSAKPQGGKMDYSPEELKQIRERKAQKLKDERKGKGDKAFDPEMGKPQPLNFDPPRIDPPEVTPPDFEFWSFNSPTLWKTVLIVVASILLLFVVYYLAKNYRPRNRKVKSDFVPNEWNPEELTKTELELRLEKVLQEENFRECVRIYFTFILKEMIHLNLIRWKKEFTNFEYLLQVRGKKTEAQFKESVRIYDLVWYGEYEIKKQDYLQLEAHLKLNYESLKVADA